MQRERGGRGGRKAGRIAYKSISKDEGTKKKTEIEKKEVQEKQSQELSEDDIPKHFLCPITHQIMLWPVIAANGQTYEQDAISEWFASHNTDPVTGVELPNKNLILNRSTKNIISEFLDNYPSLWDNDYVYFSQPKIRELSDHVRLGNIRDIDRLLDEDRRFLYKHLIDTKKLVDIILEQGTLDCLKVYFKKKPKLPTHDHEKIDMLKKAHTKFSTVGTKLFYDYLSISDQNLQEIFFTAVDTNDLILLDLSLQLGANPNKSTKKISILQFALDKNLDIFQVLSSHPLIDFPTDLLEHCIEKDKLQQFQYLISSPNKSKLSLNHVTSSSTTLLSSTIHLGKTDFFLSLLSDSLSGLLDINLRNPDGSSALITAVRTNKPEYFAELLKHRDIAIDLTDDKGNTALHYAVLSSNDTISYPIALQLVDRGANIKRKNLQGNTPINLAELNERWSLSKQLDKNFKRYKLKSVLDPLQQQVDGLTTKVRQLEEALVERNVPLQQQVDLLTAKVIQLEAALGERNNNVVNNPGVAVAPPIEESDVDLEFDLFG